MTIRYAILGLLSRLPQTGYDLKKAISNSPLLHWSGNSNQVYTTLLELNKEGCVELIQPGGAGYPGKKTYRLTFRGLTDLRTWLNQPPALPEMKNHFLIQFLFSDLLPHVRVMELLDVYAEEIRQALLIQQEQNLRESSLVPESSRQFMIQQLAGENLVGYYEHELAWIEHARQALALQNE